ncbi:MAG: ergothioneine biosynthesis protein EgtB, partial [Pseudomonadota bacterium]
MSFSLEQPATGEGGRGLVDHYLAVRRRSMSLCDTLLPEDTVVQSMADVSPTKWHLAHTTWFFERFVLRQSLRDYAPFDAAYDHLFNSYYYTVGDMFLRAHRGLLSRPALSEVVGYRKHVDEHMVALLQNAATPATLGTLVTLGLHHEQQHQELMLTDIKHVFSINPLRPCFREAAPWAGGGAGALAFIDGPSGILACGAEPGQRFCFDNETPRHDVLVRPHALASRPATNAEYLDFIRDGGYENSSLWLADGWTKIMQDGWRRPLYWGEDLASEFTLNGEVALDANAPVCHLSFYEADAFARWAGKRLPTEFELELAMAQAPVTGNLAEDDQFHPRAPLHEAPVLLQGG